MPKANKPLFLLWENVRIGKGNHWFISIFTTMKNLLAIVITIILVSNSVYSQRTILIHEKSNDKVTYSQIFKSAKLVKLETKPECLISYIGGLKVDADRIFAFDARLGIVFIFSQNGQFIDKIDRKGKGPGEMITPYGFSLDRINQQIEILDVSGKKMLIFNYNGNYIRTNKSVGVFGFEKLTNSEYIGYSYNGPFGNQDKQIQSELAIFDKEGRIIKEYQDITTIPQTVFFITGSNLFLEKSGNAYIVPIFDNSLFRVDQSLNIEKMCCFKFDTKIPKKFLTEPADFRSASIEYATNKYPYLIRGLVVVNDNVNFRFLYDSEPYHTFWNFNSKNTITIKNKNFSNDLALVGSTSFRGAFNEGVIDIVEAVDFIDVYTKAIQDDKELSVIQTAGMKNNLSTVFKATSPDDNPILIFYTYK